MWIPAPFLAFASPLLQEQWSKAVRLYGAPLSKLSGPHLLHSLPTFIAVSLLCLSLCKSCEVTSHCSSNLHFLQSNVSEYLFFCDCWLFYIIFCEMTFRSFVLSLLNIYACIKHTHNAHVCQCTCTHIYNTCTHMPPHKYMHVCFFVLSGSFYRTH